MDFLKIEGKKFLVFGVANKKSVAYFISKTLRESGAEVIFSVQSEDHKPKVMKLFPESKIFCCNVEDQADIDRLPELIGPDTILDGIVHSIAFANYSNGFVPFHETVCKDFLQAIHISCFSLVQICNALKKNLDTNASVVTISISTTRMASENYGYMAPVKAALESSLCFLTKSFSEFSNVRFNAVSAGLLKTSASAGIPNYVDSYIFAEMVIPRKKALKTQEAADTAVFLLSPRSSGINAQKIVVDAGMEINYFTKDVITKATKED